MRSNYELELIIYWIVRWNQSALIKLLSSYVQKNEDILRSLGTLDSIGLVFFCADFLRECYTSHFSTIFAFWHIDRHWSMWSRVVDTSTLNVNVWYEINLHESYHRKYNYESKYDKTRRWLVVIYRASLISFWFCND